MHHKFLPSRKTRNWVTLRSFSLNQEKSSHHYKSISAPCLIILKRIKRKILKSRGSKNYHPKNFCCLENEMRHIYSSVEENSYTRRHENNNTPDSTKRAQTERGNKKEIATKPQYGKQTTTPQRHHAPRPKKMGRASITAQRRQVRRQTKKTGEHRR